MATNSVNFFQPGTDAAIDANGIMRQRELAKLLALKGQQAPEGSMVSGHYVAPGALSYVNQLAQALTGKYIGDKADAGEREMGARLQAQRAAESQAFMQAMQGTPAVAREVDGPAAPGQAAPTQTTAAIPGDPNRAMALALQSQNPALQGMGGELMKRQMDAAELRSALQSAGIGGGGPQPEGGGAIATGGASNPAGSTGGGLPPGLSPQAFALTLSRNPQAQALGKMIQETSKPQTITEGGAIGRYGPNGQWIPDYIAPKTEAGIGVAPIAGQPGAFQANPVQGYGAAKASIAGQVAGAEAAARDPYAGLVRIGDRWMTPAQARQEAAGGGAPSPATAAPQAPVPVGANPNLVNPPGMQGRPGPTNQTEQGMAAGMAPSIQAANEATARELAATKADLASGRLNPRDADAAQQYITEMERRPAAATGMPLAVSPTAITPSAGAGRGQGGAGIPVPNEAAQSYATSRAKSYAEMAPKLQQSGQDAASSLRNLDSLETLYKDPNVAKGALAENISGLKNLGASFGIEMKGLSSEQAAEAITNKMALASRSTAEGGGMPGAMSDADRKFLANMQPGLNKTPEGRAKIIDAAKKVAQRQIDMANMAREYEMKNGQLDLGFDKMLSDYAAKNQMFSQPTKGGGFKIMGVR